ncbi:MAG: lipoprotein-releasing ABC transporter permease subunit, partial [Cocleimonas sp.]
MFQPLSAFIGLRYTKAKRDNNYISFISLASVFGIALGVIVLITVLSIMNGYVKGIQDRHLGMLSHVTVSDSDWSLPNWEERRKQVLQNDSVKSAAPYIDRQVMLKEADKVHPTLLEAVLPEYEKDIGTINRYIANPKGLNLLEAGAFNIILGETLAKTLDLVVGDSVTMLSPKQQSFLIANNETQNPDDLIPIIKEFNVVGTFKVDLQVYDKSFAYIHLDDAAELFEMNKNVTGLRAQIEDIFTARQVSEELASSSTHDYLITDWTSQHSSFFRAMQLTKTMLFLILVLIIGVAAFNLISTLIMVVTDKESDIAILRTLGMPPSQVMKVFIIQGALLALIGTIIGVVLGLLIAINVSAIVQFFESLFSTNFLNAEIHGITQIDAEIQGSDVIIIAISTFVLSVAATIFPAW